MHFDLPQLMQYVSSAGVTGVLVFIVYGFVQGWFVTGREHKASVDRAASLTTELISSKAETTKLTVEVIRLSGVCERQQGEIDRLIQAEKDERSLRHAIRGELQSMTDDRDQWRFLALGVPTDKLRPTDWGKFDGKTLHRPEAQG